MAQANAAASDRSPLGPKHLYQVGSELQCCGTRPEHGLISGRLLSHKGL